MARELDGKVALVTGASRGIGRAIAVALGALGAKVVINYVSNEAAAAEAVAAGAAGGGAPGVKRFDVAHGGAGGRAGKEDGPQGGPPHPLHNTRPARHRPP